MSKPIKQVPILTGKSAEEFIRQAEEHERNPRKPLSQEDEKQIADMMQRMRDFVPSWKKH